LPTILNFSGSDSSSAAAQNATDTLQFTALPQKGLLTSTSPALTCTNVTGAVIGEVMTNCTSATVYTPLLGATGVDTFTYTITNGLDGDTSAPATVTVTIGGATPPTAGAGFSAEIFTGVNIVNYLGGTLAELNSDADAVQALTVTITVDGLPVVHVVNGPDFVNMDFADQFPDGTVPANTPVFVVAGS
jgi:hypothetical protein